MHGHLHVDQIAGTARNLFGDRVHFAGQPLELLTGGAGVYAPQNGAGSIAPATANGTLVGAATKAHHGVIGIVVLAVIILFLLDRAGFRFAVTAGRR